MPYWDPNAITERSIHCPTHARKAAELAPNLGFDGEHRAQAIAAATFARRGTPLPSGTPVALTREFTEDENKREQWSAALKRSGLEPNVALAAMSDLLWGSLSHRPSRRITLEEQERHQSMSDIVSEGQKLQSIIENFCCCAASR